MRGKEGLICGTTAYQTTCILLAPVAVIASIGPSSIFSIASEYSFAFEAIVWTSKAIIPAYGPIPTHTENILPR
jgi:hypothetical protein